MSVYLRLCPRLGLQVTPTGVVPDRRGQRLQDHQRDVAVGLGLVALGT